MRELVWIIGCQFNPSSVTLGVDASIFFRSTEPTERCCLSYFFFHFLCWQFLTFSWFSKVEFLAIDKSSINGSLRHLGGVCDNSVGLSFSGKTNSTVAAFILSPHIVGLPTLLFRIFVNVFFSQHRARKSYKLGPFRTSHTSRLTLTQVKIRLHFVSFNCSISLFNFYCPISSYLPCLLQLRVFIQSRFLFTFQINVSSFPLLNFVRISVPTSISTSQFRLHYSVCSICFPFLSQFSPTCQFFL